MHARVIRATVAEGGMDRGLESIQNITVPAVRQLQGSKGGYWFANREAGRVIGTVFFDSEESMVGSRDAATKLREETMDSSGATLAGVDEYEVIADTGQKVSTTAKFGRLTFVQGGPGSVDTAIEQIKTVVMPGLQGMDGYAGGFWLGDRATGKAVAISLWNSKDALDASADAVSGLRTSATQAASQQVIGLEVAEIGARAETD